MEQRHLSFWPRAGDENSHTVDYQHEKCLWCPLAWVVILTLLVLSFYLGISAVVRVASAHMPDRPAMDGWLMAQKNQLGDVCCDGDDTIRLSDSEWGTENGHYWVIHDGKKEIVADSQLSPGGNRLPEALLWIWHGKVQCFKPSTFY